MGKDELVNNDVVKVELTVEKINLDGYFSCNMNLRYVNHINVITNILKIL